MMSDNQSIPGKSECNLAKAEALTSTQSSTSEVPEMQAENSDDQQLSFVPLLSTDMAGASTLSMSAVPSYILSDNTSTVSVEEMHARREELIQFSAEQSMLSSGRSMTCLPNPNNLPNMTSIHDVTAMSSMVSLNNNNVLINCDQSAFSSTVSSLSPLCRICQCTAEPDRELITPCRCNGSLKYIHSACLLKWINVSNKRHKKIGGSAFCELCGYIYKRHNYIKYRDWKWPKIALRDRILHLIFIISLLVMIGCAVATVLCFVTDDGQYKRAEARDSELTTEEIITICCGITFFLSFFISMSAEIKAKKTIHQIMKKCFRHNTVWFVENYSLANDPEYRQMLSKKAESKSKDSKPDV